MLKKILRIIVFAPQKTLFIIGLITMFWASFIPTLKLDFSVEDLFSEYDLSAKEYQDFKENFGREDNIITLIYNPNNPFSKDLYIELEEIIFQIEEFNEVNNIVSLFNLSDIDSNAWIGNFYDQTWDNSKLSKTLTYIQKDPTIGNKILSENLKYGALILSLNDIANNHSDRTRLISKIKNLLDKSTITWIFSGVTVLRTEFVHLMLKDNFIFIPFVLIILLCTLGFLFKNWVQVFLPILTVIITAIWLLGFMGLFKLEINIISYIVPNLIFIIGVADAIHIQARFKENLSKNNSDPEKVMLQTMIEMSKVIFITSITTSIGFLALTTTSIQIIREFGMEVSIGIMMAWLVSILTIPSGILTLKGFNSKTNKPFHKFLNSLSKNIILKPWYFVIIPSFICIIFISKIMEISTDASLLDDLRPNNKLYQDLKFTEKYFGGVLPFEILIIIEEGIENIKKEINYKDHIPYIEKIQTLLQTELPNSRFLSIKNIIDSAKRLQLNKKLDENELIRLVIRDNQKSKNKLVNLEKNTLRISGLIENKTSKQMEKIYIKIDSLANTFPKYLNIKYTGTTVVALKTNTYLVKSLSNSLGIALFFICVVLTLMFREKSILIVSLLTNLIPIFTMMGILAWFNIPIRVPTAMTFSVALGIAVDDSLHFLLRYKKELSKGLSKQKAIKNTLINTGSALMITTTVLVSGFLVLTLSAFLPTFQFGLLSAIMIALALICDLTLLPALCLVLSNKNMKKI